MDRVVRFDEHGPIDRLLIRNEPPRALGPGEVLLRVHAYAINPSDALIRSGRFFERPTLPSRVGYDAAGVVLAVGARAEGVAVGDRVFTLPAFLQGKHGVHGSWAIVPAYAVAPLPAQIDFATGAALGVQYSTAYFALVEVASLGPGDVVYVTAASGNTGLAAIQVAHAIGARVITVSRTRAENDALRARGVDIVVDDGADGEVARSLLDGTGGVGVRAIYDGVAGVRTRIYGDLLAMSGAVILYGFLAGDQVSLAGIPLYRKGAKLHFYQVFHFTGTEGTQANVAALDRVRSFFARELARGSLSPEIGRRFALERLHEAHAHAEGGGARGKTVVVIES